MDRFQKKCVITSAVVHGTLVLVLLIGPAFFVSSEKLDTKDIIDFIPSQIIDGAPPGGGSPQVTPPTPSPTPPAPRPEPPQPPAPKPEPKPEVKPEPKPEVKLPEPAPKLVERNIPKPDPDALEPINKPKKPKISLETVTRTDTTRPTAKAAEEAAAKERAQARADAQRRAKSFQTAMNSIRNNSSSPVDIGAPQGVGGGGPSYASFETVLRSVYFNNWREPSDATMDDAVVKTTVTIASDGTVLSARITKSSGDPAVDRSIQRLLEAVTFIAPFPEGAKEKQRTYPLSFSLKAKRSLG